MHRTPVIVLALTAVLAVVALGGLAAAEERRSVDALVDRALALLDSPRAKLLILGTFHFDDPGLDEYKPEHSVAIGSPRRQKELAALIEDLARFAPTKVAVEWPKCGDEKVRRLYAEYRRGEHRDEPDEVYQVGFRLAHRLGHERVYAVDVAGRHYEPRIDRVREAERFGLAHLIDSPWYPRYERAARWQDELKTRITLQEFFLFLNDERVLGASHGVYLVGGFKVVRNDEYPGPDHTSGWWYNRNLRIFANLLALVESPEDRVLLLIGSGHVPILRHAAEASPEVELVEPREIIGVPAG